MDANYFIPQIEPWIDDAELQELREVIDSTFITEHKKTQELEELFRNYTGTKHAIAYANGTVALFAALKVLGIGEGDEVIVPDMTFIATANAVILAGAKPVFCDIDPVTLQTTREYIEPKITSRTRAIMPVHLYGGAVQMEEILDLATQKNIKIVEDAAQGVGVRLNGKHVGTFGDVGMLSFYGNKTMTMGEGGMLLTDSEELAREIYAMKNHGRSQKGVFMHEKIGYNFSTTDLNAAIGVAQFKKLTKILERKKQIFEKYKTLLKNIKIYNYPRNVTPAQWFTSIRVEDPVALEGYLKSKNIGTRRFFYPLHLQPCYQGLGYFEGEFPGSIDAYEHGLSLPSSVTIADKDIEYITSSINDFFAGKANTDDNAGSGDSSTA